MINHNSIDSKEYGKVQLFSSVCVCNCAPFFPARAVKNIMQLEAVKLIGWHLSRTDETDDLIMSTNIDGSTAFDEVFKGRRSQTMVIRKWRGTMMGAAADVSPMGATLTEALGMNYERHSSGNEAMTDQTRAWRDATHWHYGRAATPSAAEKIGCLTSWFYHMSIVPLLTHSISWELFCDYVFLVR